MVQLYEVQRKDKQCTDFVRIEVAFTYSDNSPDGAAKNGIWSCLVVVVGLIHDTGHCFTLYTDTDQHGHMIQQT